MPYHIAIPDVCDRYGCTISDTIQIISRHLGIDPNSTLLRIPTPVNPHVTYWDRITGEIQAEIEYYVREPRSIEEDDAPTKS